MAVAACLALACSDSGHRPRRVLFVGLDGADWQYLDELIAQGTMPNLATLVREGRSGALATIHPPLSPLVWTTMMTGASPLQHGILDFVERNPETGREQPVGSGSRLLPAIWNMASERNRSVAVFGLWATYPAEPVRGLLVADRFSSFTALDREPPPGVVYPADREGWARHGLTRAERSVDLTLLRKYLPDLTAAELAAALERPDPYADPVAGLVRILIETEAYHRLAADWLRRERPNLGIVYFQGTDTIGHLFAPFAPPRQEGIDERAFARLSPVPARYFAAVDRLLGEYRELANDSGAVLFVASDHGFSWKEGRPSHLASARPGTAGRWHRDEGIFVLWGRGITPVPERGSGRVDQVCATLLALLGLPPGQGIAGPPLGGIPANEGPAVDYAAGYRPADGPSAEAGSAEEVAKLRALGYLGSQQGHPAKAGDTRTAASYNNEGLLLRQANRIAEAEQAFEEALAGDPDNASALWNLSDLLSGRANDRDRERSDALLVQAVASGLPEGTERLLARAQSAAQAGDAERSLALLTRGVEVAPYAGRLWLQRGRYLLEGQRCREAVGDFHHAAELDPANPLAHASLGLAHLCLGDAKAAAEHLRRSLALDPSQPEVRAALADLTP